MSVSSDAMVNICPPATQGRPDVVLPTFLWVQPNDSSKVWGTQGQKDLVSNNLLLQLCLHCKKEKEEVVVSSLNREATESQPGNSRIVSNIA